LNTCKTDYKDNLQYCQDTFDLEIEKFHNYRKAQKSECNRILSGVCEKRADNIWSGTFSIAQKDACIEQTIRSYADICKDLNSLECQRQLNAS